jgi:hypothetical protein
MGKARQAFPFFFVLPSSSDNHSHPRPMATYLVWSLAVLLEALILLRSTLAGLLRRYPLFYVYISCVLVKEIIGLLFYRLAPRLYAPSYWPCELATVVASYGVIIEIFRRSLGQNPGIARKAQKLLLALFVLTLSYAATDLLQSGPFSASLAIAELGRDLRYIEGALLLVMLWLLARYRISLGRNLLGLIIGYSFWVGLSVMNLAFFLPPSREFLLLVRKLLPATYVATLAIWCAALWSTQSEPVQPEESAIERDYELLAAKTRAVLNRTAHLLKVMRP